MRGVIFVVLSSLAVSASAEIILGVESINQRVWAFDAQTGAVLRNDFIVDTVRFRTAQQAIDSGRGTILVSNQGVQGDGSSVLEYDYNGQFIRTVVQGDASANNFRGIAVRGNQLFLSVAGGSVANTVQAVDLDTLQRTTFASTNLDSPYGLLFVGNDLLVTNSGTHRVERFDSAGNWTNTFITPNPTNDLRFPYQITPYAGGFAVAGMSNSGASATQFSWGLYLYDNSGVRTAYSNIGRIRGVQELGNGNILFTGAGDVGTFNPGTQSLTIIQNVQGGNFRYLSRSIAPVPEPGTIAALGLGALALIRRRKKG